MTNNTDDFDVFSDPTGLSRALMEKGKSSWDRAQEIRKKNPQLYWSHPFQKKLHERALREKEAFYDKKPVIQTTPTIENEGTENE
jgi:predicted metal-dependent phosphoesterase TrpH